MKIVGAVCVVMLLALAGCGGGGDDGGGGGNGGPGPSAGNLITGEAFKGPFTAGTVTALAISSDGTLGAVLGTAAIQASGAFTVDVGAHTGPAALRVSGGTFDDEVTGSQAQTADLHALLPAVGTGATANVTPLTAIAASRALRRMSLGAGVPDAINVTHTELGNWFGFGDVLTTLPADLAGGPVATVDAAAEYGAVLAGISQQAFALGAGADVLAAALAADAADGLMDGSDGAAPVNVPGAGALPADAAQAALATQIDAFLASAANLSGLNAADFSALTTRLAARADSLLFVMSIDVNPKNQTLGQGMTLNYTATGQFSDGSNADITSTANWGSSDTNVAAIAAGGFATAGTTAGNTDISAEQDGAIGLTVLTVSAASLVSIEVLPTTPTLFVNQSQQFTAIGTFTDTSTNDLTAAVNWNTGTPSVLSLTPGGLGQGLAAGTSIVTATDPGSMIFGDTTVTVEVPVLVSIDVTPVDPDMFVNDTLQFTAMGTFSDSSMSDVTGSVTWTSGTPAIADVSAGGLVTAHDSGTAVITATDSGTAVFGTSTVNVPALVSIAVTPGSPSLYITQTQQFTATGTYNNAAQKNITAEVVWGTTNAAVLGMSAGGMGTGVASGSAQATATLGLVSGQTGVTVFVSYANNIQTIFNASCIGCHPPERGLNLTSYAGLMAGATQGSGPVVIPNDGQSSILWQRVEGLIQPQMPNGLPPLPQAQRDRIKAWIDAGALNN